MSEKIVNYAIMEYIHVSFCLHKTEFLLFSFSGKSLSCSCALPGLSYKYCCRLFQIKLTAVSGVGSSPALGTCETSQVLLAGVPDLFVAVHIGFARVFSRVMEFNV